MTVIIEEVPELTNTFTLEAMANSGYYDLFNMDGPVIPEFAENGWIIPWMTISRTAILMTFIPVRLSPVPTMASSMRFRIWYMDRCCITAPICLKRQG